MPNKLLIVEDDPGLQKQLKWALKANYDLFFAANREQAYKLFVTHRPSIVLHDLGLPPDENGVLEGKSSINSMLNFNPNTKIIVMTGKGSYDDAVDLIRIGAHDFFNKPVELESLKLVVERAEFLGELEAEGKKLDSTSEYTDMLLPGIVGQSEAMHSIARLVNKVAKTPASVFIKGESGTGKELVARAIHQLSDRCGEPFVAINCAAIPENLLESELFGYEKGAFTGATTRNIGKIESAINGTLFLDEIGDMAFDLQSKILRFLQEKTIQRLGGNKEIVVNVRIISATHQNLIQMIEDKLFRTDLYYRINEIEINIPPLADRQQDIPLIADYLLEQYVKSQGKSKMAFTDEALAVMQSCRWEGNIRQLSSAINKAVILSEQSLITPEDMDLPEKPLSSNIDASESMMTLKDAKNMLEKDLVLRAMNTNNANIQLSAQSLGVSRQRIYEILRKNNIDY